MARQRFIHPELWSDPSLGKLMPIERLFFIGCFSNADDEGRLLGNPAYLRSTIFPYDDLTIEEVTRIRDNILTVCKNLILYTVDGVEYLAFKKWAEFQKPKYPKPSKLPSPNLEKAFPKKEETLEEELPHGLGRDGLGMGMGRDGLGASEKKSDAKPPENEPPPDATQAEREILQEFKSVPNYPFEYNKDLEHIRSLFIAFPSLDLLGEAKKWHTYKLDKPLKKTSNARLQFRNWCEVAVKEQRLRAGPEPISEKWGKETRPDKFKGLFVNLR